MADGMWKSFIHVIFFYILEVGHADQQGRPFQFFSRVFDDINRANSKHTVSLHMYSCSGPDELIKLLMLLNHAH